jgi:hypothetical protein
MDQGGRGAPVILSAHSMGAPLAVACLFSLRAQGFDTSRVALLTYGVQLRAYFGRFFPELLGPRVLGTRPTRGPSLFRTDPWTRQIADDAAAPDVNASVFPHWISLWRRTDFLGFPANSFGGRGGQGIDRAAAEWEPKTYLLTVATHSNYPDTPQYSEALGDLIRAVGDRRFRAR